MIVDFENPRHPRLVRQMLPPLEANLGESSRELRVWHSQDILVVLHTNCGGATAHGCTPPSINNWGQPVGVGHLASTQRAVAGQTEEGGRSRPLRPVVGR
jgi:hypothetical protein